MSIRKVRKKLQALDAGGPIPIYKTLVTHVSPNPVLVAFIRMAGESRPWGIAFGKANEPESMQVVSVTDPRNPKAVGGMVETFALWLLREFRVAGFSSEPMLKADAPDAGLTQIWLPGASHLAMLHLLQYQYQRSRSAEDKSALSAFGRLSGWLFRQAQLRGNQWAIDASVLLREMYEFPSDDYSNKHLNSQVSWLQPSGTLQDKRELSINASKLSVQTTLTPIIEDEIYQIFEKNGWLGGIAEEEESTSETQVVAALLKQELMARWNILREAHSLALADERVPNGGLRHVLIPDQIKAFCNEFNIPEQKALEGGTSYTPSPSGGQSAFASALEYIDAEEAEAKWLPTLIHDDDELLMEAMLDGEAFAGTVMEVGFTQDGANQASTWVIELTPRSGKYFKRRIGEQLSPLKSPNRTVEVIHFTSHSVEDSGQPQAWRLTIKWDESSKVRVASKEALASDRNWVQSRVWFVPNFSGFNFKSARQSLSKAREGASSWLFSQGAGGELVD